jgi:ribosomal-protein-alanine N-acetyltransferase
MTFLESKNLIFRPLEEADVFGNYSKWLNDQEIVFFNSHGRFPQTRESLLQYIQSKSQDTRQLVLAIVYKETNMHIGNISLQSINWIDRNAEIAFLLGEKLFWGKGVMFEAGNVLLNHAFNSLNLHRVYCGTSSQNIGMQKLAIKLGMMQEGVQKDAIFKNGKYQDIFTYAKLNNDK